MATTKTEDLSNKTKNAEQHKNSRRKALKALVTKPKPLSFEEIVSEIDAAYEKKSRELVGIEARKARILSRTVSGRNKVGQHSCTD